MKREIIKFKNENEIKELVYENNRDFNYIEEIKGYHDTEKGYVEYELIIQRKYDNKFFKIVYTKWGAGSIDFSDLEGKEVFPEIVHYINKQ